MTKWLVAAAAIVVVAIPVASAASPSKDKPKPATSAQSQSANENAAMACKAERTSVGVEAFNKKYGTNHNQRNAFGKCVSGKPKGTKDEKDEDDKDDDSGAAATACKTERASIGVDAFAKKYGTNHNLRNAFGKCVSSR